MYKSTKNCEPRHTYVTPQISPIDIGAESIICVSDGVSLGDLDEVNETW